MNKNIKQPHTTDNTDNLDMIIKLAPSLYADFPRVFGEIALVWGTPRFTKYIDGLIVVDTDRNRNGFPANIMSELFKLQNAHDRIFNLRGSGDVWDDSFGK